MKINAYAALKPKDLLQPFSYETAPLKPFEILVKVSHCGLCHSDIHLIDNDWKKSIYPLVPGHEIVGHIVEKGANAHLAIGERVGVSWVHSACLKCPCCLSGDAQICPQKMTTCNGHYGGFADYVVADSRFSFPIPELLDSASAAPLLCAGATVFAPLQRAKPKKVAVIGIGGLGHLALQFAKAMGAKVSAISHSLDKKAEAESFGADHFFTWDSPPEPSQFDFILSTVQADLDWNRIISFLEPKGTLCFVGRPLHPWLIDLSPLISFQKNICGSSTANPECMREMLQFSAKHQIQPKIELLPFHRINEGIARLKANAARYRIVLTDS